LSIEEILTVPEVAGLLRVVEKTIYTMAQRRELPAFKVRGQWRFRRRDLEAWIEEGLPLHRSVTTEKRLRESHGLRSHEPEPRRSTPIPKEQ
jgi:excisionase family DNA binding protein